MRVIFFLFCLLSTLLADVDDYEKREFHIPNDLSFLNLNDKQRFELKKLLKEHREKLKILHKKEEVWEEKLKRSFLKMSL